MPSPGCCCVCRLTAVPIPGCAGNLTTREMAINGNVVPYCGHIENNSPSWPPFATSVCELHWFFGFGFTQITIRVVFALESGVWNVYVANSSPNICGLDAGTPAGSSGLGAITGMTAVDFLCNEVTQTYGSGLTTISAQLLL